MGYVLQGVLGSPAALAPAATLVHSHTVPLRQGICLLPVGGDLYDELRRDGTADPRFTTCRLFPPGFEQTLATWSHVAPVAYVEADYFGGHGSQFAVVWHHGQISLGPLAQPVGRPLAAAGGSPISQALRALGVTRGTHHDEFDAAGLARHRDVDDWLAHG